MFPFNRFFVLTGAKCGGFKQFHMKIKYFGYNIQCGICVVKITHQKCTVYMYYETFSSFHVTYIFQGELYKMKVIYLKCCKVKTKLCLYRIKRIAHSKTASSFKQFMSMSLKGEQRKRLRGSFIMGKI